MSEHARSTQWKSLDSLDEVERDPFTEFIRREYPSQAHRLADPPERREFLKLMGASLALAGVGASCTRQPKETILPYAKMPESAIPGKPRYFATSMPWPTGAIGVLVESHEGRPTKIEGNPDHPASLGATDAITQASILGLYDPDRAKTIDYRGRIRTWGEFLVALKDAMNAQAAKQGAGLRILTGAPTSPTLEAQLADLLAKYPKAKRHVWEPALSKLALVSFYSAELLRFDAADVVVSFGADFLGAGPDCARTTREFMARRRNEEAGPSRLYVVETAVSLTGACADERLARRPSEIVAIARALADRIRRGKSSTPSITEADAWIEAVARDLEAHPKRSMVVADTTLPFEVQLAVREINASMYTTRQETPTLPAAAEARKNLRAPWLDLPSLEELTASLRDGTTELLVILGGNPVYDAPADLDFAGALARVPLRVHLSIEGNETTDLCDWHVNGTHFLETWSDALSADGSVGIVQPLIAPLYGGKSAHDLVAALADDASSGYDIVRAHWRKQLGDSEFEHRWKRALHDGIVQGRGPEIPGVLLALHEAGEPSPVASSGTLDLVFRPDPTIFDGRLANNGWLQELPKPITKLTWDNAAHVSPSTAKDLDVENEDVVELELDGRKVRAPIWIVPGQAVGTVVVHLGYGRARTGRVGTGAGFDAYALRTTKAMWSASGLKVTKTGEKQKLSCTQEHDRMEGRDPVRVVGADGASRGHVGGEGSSEHEHERDARGLEVQPALHTFSAKGDYAWGMVIDLASCTGCSACVAACTAENNVPIVGRDQVRRGREMHWIRVDRYFEGEARAPAVHHQPIPCMHCENAPCETVCPVGATTHSDEGLNQMTYNRCVGTRYCLNNCPYKVRRFNFYLYQDFETEVTKLQRNPDVSVRSRGVMEKCSYCVQRIQEARIHAEKEGRKIRDGEVRTACQQVCPAEAITFGNIDDPASAVAKKKKDPREYGLLEELNTRPRTTYLAKVVNENPALAHGETSAPGDSTPAAGGRERKDEGR